jgi:polyhydroxyalkanoate synthase
MSTPATENPQKSLDPVALAESLAAAAEKSAKVIGEFATRNAKSGSLPSDELGLGKAFLELAAQMLANPARLAESQMNLWWEYMSLWQGSMLRLMGAQATPVAVHVRAEKRRNDHRANYNRNTFFQDADTGNKRRKHHHQDKVRR